MQGQRINRGFRRLGIALAFPFLLAAVVCVGVFVFSSPIAPAPPSKSSSTGLFDDLIPRDNIRKKNAEPSSTDEWWKKDPIVQPTRSTEPLLWATTLAAIGVVMFVLCAGLGWVFAGFARD
jgi:hypothetical protein